MNAKFYTLADARETLPKVRALMERAQQARQDILRLRPQAWPALAAAAANGGSREAGDMWVAFSKLETSVKGIMALGIYVKDLDTGIVDFLGQRDGHEVYLCWRLGEDDIRFWHEPETGFAGRKPIDDLVE